MKVIAKGKLTKCTKNSKRKWGFQYRTERNDGLHKPFDALCLSHQKRTSLRRDTGSMRNPHEERLTIKNQPK